MVLPVNKSIYTLEETKAPEGYKKIGGNIQFTVSSNGVAGAEKELDKSGNPTGYYVITVQNSAGEELPMTGGSGTLLYTLSGLMLIVASALMYGFRMRRGERRIR